MQEQQAPAPENPNAPLPEESPSGEDAPLDEALKPTEISSFSDFTTYLFDRFESYVTGAIALAPKLIIAAIILALTWLVARGVRFVAGWITHRTHARQSLTDLAKTLSGLLVWFFGGFSALAVIFPSINPSSLLAGLGVGGIVIGIAFQDIFKNFMAGVLILARKTMSIGDYISSGDVEGRIERITLRDTYLRRVDRELVLVPNAYLFENPVRVWTDPDHRRYDVVVGVGYGENVAEARQVIEKAVSTLEFGSANKPQVFAAEFADSSINFNVRWWAEPEPLDMHRSRDQVVQAIKEALDGAGIEIPFPYRTLTFAEGLRIDGGPKDEEKQQDAEAAE
ncbi:mechanosensitive ion channel family protein [Parvularcula maris]|uniref:Small-conductance mechanosensitive channel n=1 Tax=Parvularcula maris TaxID=2965077 RepID=A0A9X2L8E7_9PROT|nr:mechanosensitive ion channel family protein [Parvularcula maris]MCQ8184986.1 mechanosensitive ion channel family protein [Parvularcula maris]